MQTIHLFAGAGGGLLADLILGHKPIVAVEWDKYACKVLRERAADGWFPDLSVWEGDVRLFNPSEYAGKVDCIHAGFPCQDISTAGKQAGVGEETRSGLYREVLRIADVVRPKELFLENVSAILSNGLGTVLADLSERGYSARWMCLRASDVGANHQRDRWWLLARKMGDPESEQCNGSNYNSGSIIKPISIPESGNASREEDVGDSEHDGQPSSEITGSTTQRGHSDSTWKEQASKLARSGEQSESVAYSNPDDVQGVEQEPQPGGYGRQAGLFGGARSTPAAGWWEAEPGVGRVANGVADRVGKLKALGNGQVPLQAAVAYSILREAFNAIQNNKSVR